MANTLLIIGGGAEQVPAYEKAKRRGLFVVGSDMNPDAPALALADHVLLASTRDADASVAAAEAFHATHPIDGVMTIANDVPYTVARIAEKLGLPGIPPQAALNVIDKLVMKTRFAEAGVACPWFRDVRSLDELERFLGAEPDQAFVLKPVNGRGARGVLLIDAATDLAWAFAESTRWGDCGRLILEKFVPGMQLSTESFVLDGTCHTPAIAERNYARLDEFKPYIIEDGGTIPPALSAGTLAEIDDLILRGAAALGIHAGIVKGDLVIGADGKPLIIELAARLSGGWFATHQIPAASGVDLVEAVITHALGETVDPRTLEPTRHRATAIRYWYPPAGRIVAIRGEEDLKKIPGLISYGFFRKPGDMQPVVRTHPDRFGFAIVEADTRAEAEARIAAALSCIAVEVETAD